MSIPEHEIELFDRMMEYSHLEQRLENCERLLWHFLSSLLDEEGRTVPDTLQNLRDEFVDAAQYLSSDLASGLIDLGNGDYRLFHTQNVGVNHFGD